MKNKQKSARFFGIFQNVFLYSHIVTEYTLDIGKCFEAIFLVVNRIFLASNQALKFTIFHFLHEQPLHQCGWKSEKRWEHENFLESCKERSKLFVDGFGGR